LARGAIYSDEGFSVSLAVRTEMTYRESRRKMTLAGERTNNGFVVNSSTIGPWDDGGSIDATKKEEIIDRIRRALESQGMAIDFV
jgi:hypothetical protein